MSLAVMPVRLGRSTHTVTFKRSRRFGHNTDWSGFAESFRRSLPRCFARKDRSIRCGGAGAAVAHALLTLGAGELSIIDTERQRAASLVEALRARYGADRAHCRSWNKHSRGFVATNDYVLDVSKHLFGPRPFESELCREPRPTGASIKSLRPIFPGRSFTMT